MNVHEARELFPGSLNKTFLDSACVGLVPTTAKKEITRFLDMAVQCPAKDVSEHHIAMDKMKYDAKIQASSLLNTDLDNVVLIESTTHGLNIACNSIKFSKTDEVLIYDTEYLQVAIPFVKKSQAQKLTLVPLHVLKDGRITLNEFENKITKNTKAICLSAVQWCTGQRTFTKELGELCKAKGIWLIVDGVQEAGALDINMDNRYCDFYITGGHKWLNAPYGCGFMYMSKRAQSLEPPSFGYLNLPDPPNGWGAYFQDPQQTPFCDYTFSKSAQSFGTGGTGNYPGAIGLGESIKIVNTITPKIIEDRILELTMFLRKELQKINVLVMSSSNPADMSGITIFRIFDTPKEDRLALDYFLSKRILLSIRYTNNHGGLRASTHYFNTEEDILKLCHAITHMRNNNGAHKKQLSYAG